MTDIKVVTEDNHDAFFNCIVASFISDPLLRFLFPESERYLNYCGGLAKLYIGSALEDGTCWKIGEYEGVAAWMKPDATQKEDEMGEFLSNYVYPDHLEEAMQGFGSLEQYHPSEPHWYLPIIGVDPYHWGKGRGTVLMDYVLKHIDDEHVPVYLESSNPMNIGLYERLGFKILDKIALGGNHVITPMLRDAR